MNYAIVRKSDMLVTEVNSSAQTPDPNLFLEIATQQDLSGIATNDFRYNQYDSTFYAVGVKASIAEPEVQIVKQSAFQDPEGKRARLKGTHSQNCPAGQATTMLFAVPSGGRILDGAEYEARAPNFGDNINFEIVAPDGQGGYTVLDEFAKNWYVCDKPRLYRVYPSWLPFGLQVRITYNNVGADDVLFQCNLFLHLDTTAS